jgi:DNA-binding NtrC family response regulator
MLRQAGHDVVSFASSMDALSALEDPETVELLITRVRFPPGTPHGIALARMAQQKRPGIKIIFTGREEMEEFTERLGEFIPHPVSIPALVEAANRLVEQDEPPRSAS